jgi:hypothetical protein
MEGIVSALALMVQLELWDLGNESSINVYVSDKHY